MSAQSHLIAQKYMSCRSFLLEHSAVNAFAYNNLPDLSRWPFSLILQAWIDLFYIPDFQAIMCRSFPVTGIADVSPACLAVGRAVLLHWAKFKSLGCDSGKESNKCQPTLCPDLLHTYAIFL